MSPPQPASRQLRVSQATWCSCTAYSDEVLCFWVAIALTPRATRTSERAVLCVLLRVAAGPQTGCGLPGKYKTYIWLSYSAKTFLCFAEVQQRFCKLTTTRSVSALCSSYQIAQYISATGLITEDFLALPNCPARESLRSGYECLSRCL